MFTSGKEISKRFFKHYIISFPTQVIQQRLSQGGGWSSDEELPIRIDLGAGYRFHSVFACPILRQQTTEANPSMRLVCGHCISRDALYKLKNGNRSVLLFYPFSCIPGERGVSLVFSCGRL